MRGRSPSLPEVQGEQLLQAARSGDLATVEALVAARPELVTYADEDDWTALLYAARARQHPVMRCLLKHGPAIDAPLPNGLSPLQVAARAGDELMMRALLSHDALLDPFSALILGAEGFLKRALKSKSETVELRDGRGDTLLHWAVEADLVDLAVLLLDYDAPIDAPDAAGLTPIRRLLRREPDQLAGPMAELLVEHGAWIDPVMAAALDLPAQLPDDPLDLRAEGRSLLHWAAWGGANRTIRKLLALGAKPAERDAAGYNAVELAEAHGHARASELLRNGH